jgi:outer membrane cobalamin receptor
MQHKTFAMVLFAAATAQTALAQNAGPEELVVIGQRLEESIPLDLQQFGNRVEIITAEQLQLGGFNDVGQALQMEVPGLYVAPKNGAFDYMDCSLQGSRCQDVLWLVDGVRINNRLYNTTAPLDTVPAHMIERIEVLYGGQGIFYGTQSVAGVVNIVTKSLSNEPEGNVGVGFDANDGTHISADYRTAFGDHQMVFYASQDEADGFQPYLDRDYQPSGSDRDRGYDVLTAGVKYGYAFSGDSEIKLHYHHTDNEVEFAAPSNTLRSFNERDEDLITAKWDYSVNDDVDLFVKGYFHSWDSHFTEFDNELSPAGQLTGNVLTISNREFWGYEDYGLTAMARVRSDSGLEYAFGYDRQEFSGRDDVLLIADRTESVDAFFGQIRAGENVFDKTALAFGFRHNRPSGEGDVTVANISARHDISDNFYVRGGAGTSFRLPDAFQLYGNDSCCTLGNPNLEGEKSRNTDVAVGGRNGLGNGLSWEFTIFDREVDNLIGSENGVRINTGSTVDFEGWEATATVELQSRWRASFSYTDTSAKARGSSDQVEGIPESSFKVGLRYQPDNAPYEIGVSVVNLGDVWDSVSGGIGRREHGNYTLLDVNTGYTFGDGERQRIGLRVENLTDKTYASSLGRGFVDTDGSSFAYQNLGTPRTLHVNYRHKF